MKNKLKGVVTPYMMGVVLGIATFSTISANQAKKQNEIYQTEYTKAKQDYINKLSKSLENVIYTEDTTSDSSITATRVQQHIYTNIFDTTDIDVAVNEGAEADGSKLSTITLEDNEYKRNQSLISTSSIILEQDIGYSATAVINEDAIREKQINQSYNKLRKQANKMYEDVLLSTEKKWPCSYTAYEKDAWNRDFTYTRESAFKSTISFNLPWDTTTSKYFNLTLPEVPTGVYVVDMQTGANVTYVLLSNGELYGAGQNDNGKMGIGITADQLNWIYLGINDIKAIRITRYSTNSGIFAIKNNGDVWFTGTPAYYAGFGATNNNQETWIDTGMRNAKSIDVIYEARQAYVITNDGELWVSAPGYYSSGVGTPPDQGIRLWTQTPLTDVKSVTLIRNAAYAIKNNGELWVTGNQSYGELGNGTTTTAVSAWQQSTLTNVRDVYADTLFYSVYAVTNDNKLHVTGYNSYGELGIGSTSIQDSWREVTDFANVKKVILVERNAYALTTNGDVWAAGENANGEVGIGTTGTESTWKKTALEDIIDVIGAYRSVFAVKNDGTLWGAGLNTYNWFGAIGSPVTTFTQISGMPFIKKIGSFNRYSVFAITEDDSVVYQGKWQIKGGVSVANGTTLASGWIDTGIDNWTIFTTESYATRALIAEEGTTHIWAIGTNPNGQLGLGDTEDHYNYWEQSASLCDLGLL